MSLLDIQNITISYKDVPTVIDFSMKLEEGEICSLVGESGSGKTTVIRAVFGLLAGGHGETEGYKCHQHCCYFELFHVFDVFWVNKMGLKMLR